MGSYKLMLIKLIKRSVNKLLFYIQSTYKPSNELLEKHAVELIKRFSTKQPSKVAIQFDELEYRRKVILTSIKMFNQLNIVISDDIKYICCDRYTLVIPTNRLNDINLDVEILLAFFEAYFLIDYHDEHKQFVNIVSLFIWYEYLISAKTKLNNFVYTNTQWTKKQQVAFVRLLKLNLVEIKKISDNLLIDAVNESFDKVQVNRFINFYNKYYLRWEYLFSIWDFYISNKDDKYISMINESIDVSNLSLPYRLDARFKQSSIIGFFYIKKSFTFTAFLKPCIEVIYQIKMPSIITNLDYALTILQKTRDLMHDKTRQLIKTDAYETLFVE